MLDTDEGYLGKATGMAPTKRMRDLLDVAWIVAARDYVKKGLHFYIDASQCVSREPWGKSIRTLTTSSIVVDALLDRRLMEEELWAAQGAPTGAAAACQGP